MCWKLVIMLALLFTTGETSFQLVDSSGVTITNEQMGLLLWKGGTVCDDGFSGSNSATAICKELGYESSASWSSGNPWSSLQAPYDIKANYVVCSSPTWSSCSYSEFQPGYTGCSHGEDIFLTCRGLTICSPGMYRISGPCIQCQDNTYKAVVGFQACTNCPELSTANQGSTYCSCKPGTFWNQTTCHNCSQGLVSPHNTTQCSECPSGSAAFENGTKCSCPIGTEWSWDSQTNGSCKSCPLNSYKNEQMTGCSTCPENTTSPEHSAYCICRLGMFWNNTGCQNCSHTSASQRGALQCTPCPSGSIASSEGSSCKCPIGTVWNWTAQTSGSCTRCKRDTYSADGMSACLQCPSLSTSTAGSRSCLCLPGTFKNPNMTSCTICPAGTSSNVGSEHCICSSGQYWNDTLCKKCAQGTVSQESSLRCKSCPAGNLTPSGGTECACPAGTVWKWDELHDGSCKQCLPGTYKSEQMLSCTVCPKGTTSTASFDFCSCTSGMFWNGTRCDDCPQGLASPQGSDQCLDCPYGSKAFKSGSSCSCPIGSQWEWNALTNGSCTLCPPGTFKSEIMLSCLSCPKGSSSNLDYRYCICESGMFWNQTSCQNCSYGFASVRGALRCQPCPAGTSQDPSVKSSCICPRGKVWSWSERGEGSCLSLPQSLSVVLILAGTAALLSGISFTLGLLLFREKKREEGPVRVRYNAEEGVKIDGQEERGISVVGYPVESHMMLDEGGICGSAAQDGQGSFLDSENIYDNIES